MPNFKFIVSSILTISILTFSPGVRPAAAQLDTVVGAASSAVGLDSSLSTALGALGITSSTPISSIMSMLSFEPIMMVGKCVDESLTTGIPGDMLSFTQVTLTELGLKYMFSRAKTDIQKAFTNAAQANNTLAASIADKNAAKAADEVERDIQIRAKEKQIDIIEGLPTGTADCNQTTGKFGYTLTRSKIVSDQLNRILQEGTTLKNPGSNSSKLKQQASKAKNTTDNLMLFTDSGTYDDTNLQAAMAFHDLLFPKKFQTQSSMTGFIDDVTGEQSRILASQGLRTFILDRAGVIPKEDLEKGMAEIPQSKTQSQKTDRKNFADVKGKDADVKKVSRDMYWRGIVDSYSSPQFLAKLDGLNEEGIWKEFVRMESYKNQLMLEIRERSTLTNALESISAKRVAKNN